jgi:hypothetical protein
MQFESAIVVLEAQISQVHPDVEVGEPIHLRWKLGFQPRLVMLTPENGIAQKQDWATGAGHDRVLHGGCFFLPLDAACCLAASWGRQQGAFRGIDEQLFDIGKRRCQFLDLVELAFRQHAQLVEGGRHNRGQPMNVRAGLGAIQAKPISPHIKGGIGLAVGQAEEQLFLHRCQSAFGASTRLTLPLGAGLLLAFLRRTVEVLGENGQKFVKSSARETRQGSELSIVHLGQIRKHTGPPRWKCRRIVHAPLLSNKSLALAGLFQCNLARDMTGSVGDRSPTIQSSFQGRRRFAVPGPL